MCNITKLREFAQSRNLLNRHDCTIIYVQSATLFLSFLATSKQNNETHRLPTMNITKYAFKVSGGQLASTLVLVAVRASFSIVQINRLVTNIPDNRVGRI